MAGVHHTYTSTASAQVLLGYQCSKCGKRQLFKQSIKSSATTNDKGVIFESTLEKRKSQAQREAHEGLMSDMLKFKTQIGQRKFRCLKNVLPCTSCGHTEPWGSVGNRTIETLQLIMGLAAFITFFIWLFAIKFDGNFKFYWPLGFGAVAVLLIIIHNYICEQQETRIVKTIPVECLPVVLNSQEEVQAFLLKSDFSASAQSEHSEKSKSGTK